MYVIDRRRDSGGKSLANRQRFIRRARALVRRAVKDAAGNAKNEVSPGSAKFVVIAVGVTLPAVGSPNTDGYQPASQVQLTSDVVLRNSIVY